MIGKKRNNFGTIIDVEGLTATPQKIRVRWDSEQEGRKASRSCEVLLSNLTVLSPDLPCAAPSKYETVFISPGQEEAWIAQYNHEFEVSRFCYSKWLYLTHLIAQ